MLAVSWSLYASKRHGAVWCSSGQVFHGKPWPQPRSCNVQTWSRLSCSTGSQELQLWANSAALQSVACSGSPPAHFVAPLLPPITTQMLHAMPHLGYPHLPSAGTSLTQRGRRWAVWPRWQPSTSAASTCPATRHPSTWEDMVSHPTWSSKYALHSLSPYQPAPVCCAASSCSAGCQERLPAMPPSMHSPSCCALLLTVVIINAEKVSVTGRKETDKTYFRHTIGRPGAWRVEALRDLRQVSRQRGGKALSV
jgi:hypothetical protein